MAAGLSAGNPAVKRLRHLSRSARARRTDGVVVVEGPRAVRAAVESGARVHAVYLEPSRLGPLADELSSAGVVVRPVADGVLRSVLSTTSPVPVAALVARPEAGALPGPDPRGGPTVVLGGVGDPGNVGTIIRSAVAAGSGPVVLGPRSADPFGPKAVRASAGTVFDASVNEATDLAAVLAALRSSGHRILGAAPRGGLPHDQVDLTGVIALVMGGETAGLPDAVDEDAVVSIPQAGPAESLNVAMAATVLLFEAARQRRLGATP